MEDDLKKKQKKQSFKTLPVKVSQDCLNKKEKIMENNLKKK
jgi:hypothetical protein